MDKPRVELRKTEGLSQPWYWVVVAPNDRVVLTSENYYTKGDAHYQAIQEAEAREFDFVDTT